MKRYLVDFHLHSRYSIATAKNAHLPAYETAALFKGIRVVGTGDCQHPVYLQDMEEMLQDEGNGLFRLKPEYSQRGDCPLSVRGKPVSFMLTTEVSTIFKRYGKVRKVHSVIVCDTFDKVRVLQKKLERIGNIKSDGRPILGLDVKDLLHMVLDIGDGCYLIPAHIWTPWFSALGSKSGFDSIEETFEDLTGHIAALETGLSSDPVMNHLVSANDRFLLVSNSDAHSPDKLGRNANIFWGEVSFAAIHDTLLRQRGPVPGTIDLFPEEGKYHLDGHRKCGFCLDPREERLPDNRCPVCGKPLTIGVLNRVVQLADRRQAENVNQQPGLYIIPLKEILSELIGYSPKCKRVVQRYKTLIDRLGAELDILLYQDIDTIAGKSDGLLAQAITRLRAHQVIRQGGFDGQYGVIRLFSPEELEALKARFIPGVTICKKRKKKSLVNRQQPLFAAETSRPSATWTIRQQEVIDSNYSTTIVMAGPGAGKTAVMVERILTLVRAGIAPAHILATTFTIHAAREIHARVQAGLHTAHGPYIATLHALAYAVIRRHCAANQQEAPVIVTDLPKDVKAPDQVVELSDLVPRALELLRREGLHLLPAPFKHVIVDEFQDIDAQQYDFILTAAQQSKLTVIGDEHQSIYGFRGCSPRFFDRLAKDRQHVGVIRLDKSFRVPGHVLRAAYQLLGASDTVHSVSPVCAKVQCVRAGNIQQQVRLMVAEIEKAISGSGFYYYDMQDVDHDSPSRSYQDIAVLYRSNRMGDIIEKELQQHNVPVKRYNSGMGRQTPLARLIALLKLYIMARSGAKGYIPLTLLAQPGFIPLNGTSSWRQGVPYAPCYQAAVQEAGRLADQHSGSVSIDEIKAFLVGPGSYWLPDCIGSRDTQALALHIHAHQRQLWLMNDIDLLGPQCQGVNLMTIHSAKGLEFDTVCLPLFQDPFYRPNAGDDAEQQAEERRVLFVALSRAKRQLFLYASQQPAAYLADIAADNLLMRDNRRLGPKQKRLF